MPLLLAHSVLLAVCVPASDSFIFATGITRMSHAASGMGETAGALVPLQETQAL